MRLKVLMLGTLTLIAISAQAVDAKERGCIDWVRVMTERGIELAPGGKTILVEPFTDFTKAPGDDWLVMGTGDYLADLLHAGENLRVLAGPTALKGRVSGPADYLVGGSFQHAGDTLRIFVRLTDGNTAALLRQFEVVVHYPDNKDFFKMLADAAKQIIDIAGAKIDGSAVSAVRDATASTRAYASFDQGRRVLETFKADKADAATAHFTEAKRIDYRSPLGYQGMIDLYTFLGFYHKLRNEAFATYFQKAEEEMAQMARLAKPAPAVFSSIDKRKRRSNAPKYVNRFISGNVAYSEGLVFAQAGKFKEAAEAFRRAVQEVPEDAAAWYHLSRMESKLGNEETSREALQKAYGINSCIEQ